jgi:hypothetical protein
MFDTLLENAQTIHRVVFSGYTTPLPELGFSNLTKTSVTSWWFFRSAPALILHWADRSRFLPEGSVDEIVLTTVTIDQPAFKRFVESIRASKAALLMKKFELTRVILRPFPFPELFQLFSVCANLSTIVFRGIEMDASTLFSSVVKSGGHLRKIVFSHMQFRSPLEASLEVPPALLHLGIANNSIATSALVSLLKVLTAGPRAVPIVLDAASLVLKPTAYAAMSELPFDRCHPNLAELDWSGNFVPADARFFFAFLFTQKRIRLFVMNNCSLEDPMEFMKLLMQLGISLPVYGLDFSGAFEPLLFAQFIQALATWPNLRRLNIAKSGAGDAGIGALNELLESQTSIMELGADGFAPSCAAAIETVWTTISRHPSIIACDLPVEDMRAVAMDSGNFRQEFAQAYFVLNAKPRITTVEQRVAFTAQTIDAGKEPEFSDEIFLKAAVNLGWNTAGYDEAEQPEIDEAEAE